MQQALNREMKTLLISVFFLIAGFALFYGLQSMTSTTADETIVFKKVSFIMLIVCSMVATTISGYPLTKKRSVLCYIVFISELLWTISLTAFYLFSQTLFWM